MPMPTDHSQRLRDLYAAVGKLRAQGINLDPTQTAILSRVEETLIREDFIPVIKERAEVTLAHVLRPLRITITFDPHRPLIVDFE